MPSENIAFTTRVEPVSPPEAAGRARFVAIGITETGGKLVEAPGTAPGSATLIP